MKVLKFGGSSLKNADAIKQMSQIVSSSESQCCVVVSAIGDTTDELQAISEQAQKDDESYKESLDTLQAYHEKLYQELTGKEATAELVEAFDHLRRVCGGVFLLKELTRKSLDFILGSGEIASSIIVSAFLESLQLKVKRFDTRQYIVTNGQFGDASVDFATTTNQLNRVSNEFSAINVFPGFVAATATGEMTTLGRGGSDYTAAIIASALDAGMLEIWTDVDGIMTADPRRVKRSHTLDQVSYAEALELSYFGAKVIYPKSIVPVLDAGIEVRVKNTFDPENSGTLITQDPNKDHLIKGISSIDEVTILSISGRKLKENREFFSRIFRLLATHEVPIIFMTHSNSGLTLTIGLNAKDAHATHELVKQEFGSMDEKRVVDSLKLEEGYSLLALVGSNMKDQIGVSGTMFNVLGKNGISIKAISQGSSERTISAIIPKVDLNKALNVLHESFFLSPVRRVNLFIIGVGNVGKAFLDQLTQQFKYLKNDHHLNMKVIGIANSRQMAFEFDGIPLSKWKDYLEKGKAFTKEDFIKEMVDLNFRNSIFIDITASEDISSLYQQVLKESISVVTPNKIAATRSYEEYLNLKDLARRYRSQFLIETNVCAGLPILSTLHDLVRSGDQVMKVQAVLSGTLNFLFNEYNGTVPFYQVVQKAKELGYTEPDPRLDLSGEDVMRKLLILIRESGYEMEMADIQATLFLPDDCLDTADLDDFYEKVANQEAYFKAMYDKAQANGTRLKFVATYENGEGSVALEEIPDDHPFYHLEGKDNVVLFYTQRYSEQPLVIKGAGAGAEVTASGIFADVLRLTQAD